MTSRKGDINITICQNNDEAKLIVEAADSAIENVIGYESEELVGKDITEILLPDVREIIYTHLDYNDPDSDLASVLGKVRDFGFITKLGYEVKLNMRVNHALTDDSYPKFQLIVKDHSEVSEGSKSALRNFRGRQSINQDTGLPDQESFMKEAEFINFCVSKDRISASFALVSVDGIENFSEQYGEDFTKEMLRDLIGRCQMNFREDDIMASLEDNLIGVILLDANTSAAKIPLNRLRWQVASQPFTGSDGQTANLTLSIAYSSITQEHLVEDAIKICEEKLQELRVDGGNKIAEVEI